MLAKTRALNPMNKLAQHTPRKFIESYPGNGRKIMTPNGYVDILAVHKTVPYAKFRVTLENGMSIDCAYNHVLICDTGQEIYAKDSIGTIMQTVNGNSKVVEVTDLQTEEHMYDISVDSCDELYYSNGILSHNSGKSVSTGIYLAHLYNFRTDLSMGIVANRGSTAREILNTVKNIIIAIPVWMQQGTEIWNKGSIENESKMRILTDVPTADAFTGFTMAVLVVDECAKIPSTDWETFADSIFPSQSGLAWKKNIIISTAFGINHYYDMVQGARENMNGYKLFEVDWKDVPRYKADGSLLSPEDFSAEVIKKHGIVYFNQNYGCVDGSSIINIFDKETGERSNVRIDEFEKLPNDVTGFIQNRYQILTESGYSDFDNIVNTGLKNTLEIELETEHIEVSVDHIFSKDQTSINAKDLAVGDFLETKSGAQKITSIKKSKNVTYEVLETKDHTYFANDVLNHNCEFVGSSHTLISSNVLQKLTHGDIHEMRDGKLNIYHYPVKGHKYIMTVDAAKDGTDSFAVQIIDITEYRFVQSATAQLQIDYLLMPEFLHEWAEYYNNPYLIIENNEGAGQSVADQMYQTYEYENLHFDKAYGGKQRKKYPGFRTTTKTRKQILQTLKLFMENDSLEINNKSTINEFFRFILINNKYQADNGAHDDMIMSLAMAFVPFCDAKNFEDMKVLVQNLYNSDELADNEKVNFGDLLVLGDFDDFSDDNYSKPGEYTTIEEAMNDMGGFI